MNQINIIGRIGKEVELKYLASGSALANFSIAVNQDYKKQDGTKVEKTSWFDITAFGKTAENVNTFFNKGSMIGITGELEQQTWDAQDGSKRSKVVIKLQSFTFIDKKADNQGGGYNQPSSQPQQNDNNQQYNQPQQHNYNVPQQQNVPTIDINDDEIPFNEAQ